MLDRLLRLVAPLLLAAALLWSPTGCAATVCVSGVANVTGVPPAPPVQTPIKMALILLGGGVAGASGSIGGTTFARNRSGAYARNRTKPVNPQTTEQTAVRAIMASLVTAWLETLDDAQRDGWNTYAANVPVVNKLGQSVNITGQNWYVGNNTAAIQSGLARQDDAPAIFDRGTFTPATIHGIVLAQQVSIAFDNTDDWANEDGAAMLVYASREVNPTRSFPSGSYRLAGRIDGDSVTPPTSPQGLTSPFVLDTGNRQFYRVVVVRADGRVSTAQKTDGIITAV